MTVRFGQCFCDPEASMAHRLEGSAPLPAAADSRKRRQIIDGARRLFLAQGFDAASMSAIAQAAGVSKGTLYVYFKSKEALFEAIVEEQGAKQAEQIFTFSKTEDVASVLTRVGGEVVRFLCRPGGVPPLRAVIAIADRMPELGAKFYLAGPARGIASLTAYLEEQVAAGVLKPHDCEIAAAQFIDSCLSLTFKPMLFNFAGAPEEQRIDRVVRMAVRALIAPLPIGAWRPRIEAHQVLCARRRGWPSPAAPGGGCAGAERADLAAPRLGVGVTSTAMSHGHVARPCRTAMSHGHVAMRGPCPLGWPCHVGLCSI
jgi:AcrR family transcriptional regulator